jgi:hypothetical protein
MNKQVLRSEPISTTMSQGIQKCSFRVKVPVTLFAITKYFILEEIQFKLNEIPYCLSKFSSLRNLNLSLLTTPKLNFYDSGFINQFENSLFVDLIGFNYFYFDVDICDPKNFSIK